MATLPTMWSGQGSCLSPSQISPTDMTQQDQEVGVNEMNPLVWTILLDLEYLSRWNQWAKMDPASAAATEVEANLVVEETEKVKNQEEWTTPDTHE